MNYAAEQRIRFIDFLLYTYGWIGRQVLVDYFAIGPATATRDIREYIKLSPENITFDVTEKRYITTAQYKPLFSCEPYVPTEDGQGD